MSTSKNSGSEPLDWARPWRVDRPSRARPPLGPERDAWLEQRTLFRSAADLKATLDRINPSIALNQPIDELDEDAVTNALLELLEPDLVENGDVIGKQRMPLHRAHVLLRYFIQGFRSYCHTHGLRSPRLPLMREFSLDEGSLRAESFEMLRQYRLSKDTLLAAIEADVLTPSRIQLPTDNLAALIVCSSALFGGLLQRTHWERLVATLCEPFQRIGDLFAFRLVDRHLYRWIADPVTEALLRRFWHAGLLPLPKGTKVTPAAINTTLGLQGSSGQALGRLEDLVRAAHLRHFAPDVSAVAQGHIPNTSLAEEPWLRLMSGKRHAATRKRIVSSIPGIQPAVQAGNVEQSATSQIIDDIGRAVTWNPAALRRNASDHVKAGDGVSAYLGRLKISLREAEGRLEQIYAKAGHRGAHRNSFAYGLLCYTNDLRELGGLKVRTLAPSTIHSYVSIVRNHLAKLHHADLALLGTEERAEAYRKAIRGQSVGDRSVHRTALEGFERSLLRHMDGIDEVDWATIPGQGRSQHLPSVDANLIEPALYRHVLDALERPAQEDSLCELARALLVVLYRFGLRTGEAKEVTAGSILRHAEGIASLRVSRSALTSRKSTNALRVVGPIALPAHEAEFLFDYRDRKANAAAQRGRDRAGTYLFSGGGTDNFEQVEAAQKLLIDLIRDASGDENLRPRHFRHGFVSRCFLSDRDPFGQLEPVANASGDAWWRTFTTGHASPDTGIVSYTHVVELAHYHHACQLISAVNPASFLSRLAGNEGRTLDRSRLRHDTDAVEISLFRASLRRRFPCTDIPDRLAKRVDYAPITVSRNPEPLQEAAQRLAWEDGWQVYANARVGHTTGDLSDHARSIRARVRELEERGNLRRRLKRRPQLGQDEWAAAATLWRALAHDDDLCRVIESAAEYLPAKGAQILIPANLARRLENHLRRCGLVRIESHPTLRNQIRLRNPDGRGELSSSWLELLGFLYAGLEQRN